MGYVADVAIGVTGSFYTEVIRGVAEGQYVIIGDIEDTESALQTGGPPGRPNREN